MAVVYVAGTMRSATTIVGQMVAASPDTALIGEVRPILLEPEQHEHCDCGHTRRTCPFWGAVLAANGGLPSAADARTAYRVTAVPSLALAVVLHRRPPRGAAAVVEFLRAIAAVAGDCTIIDTSKAPAGILLWRLAGQQVDVVHALRSPRAVAEAQARPSAKSGLTQERRAKSLAVWAVYNALTSLLRPFTRSYTPAFYGQVRNTPRGVASRLWRRAALTAPPDDSGNRFDYTDSHVLAGNPRRARGTTVTIMPMSSVGTESPLPDFVIIGAQKAGSTSLMQQLGNHPNVYLPSAETRYFRYPWFEFQDESALRDAVRTHKSGVVRRGIKCPDLLCVDEYADRVVAALPTAKLIAVLREPVSRAVSGYHWLMQWGYLPVADIEVGLPRIMDGAYDQEWPRASEVLEFGRYGAHLKHWLELVPREQLFVLIDQDLHRDPAATLRHTFEFLGVSTDVPITQTRPVNSGVYSLERLRFLQRRLPFILRSFPGYEGRYLLAPPKPFAWVADRTLAIIDRTVLARRYTNRRPQISAALSGRLAEYYRDDIALVEEILGRDLADWKQPSAAPAELDDDMD